MTIGAELYNEIIVYFNKAKYYQHQKYIEIAIFTVITGLLSGTGSYFVNKKIKKLKENRREKRKKINN